MAKKDEFIKLNKAIDKKLDGEEKEIAKEYTSTLANIKQVLAEVYEKYSDNDILTREEMVKFGRLAKLEKHLVEQIQNLTKTQIRLTKKSIKNVFLESYYRYGYFIENQVELAIYKLLKPDIIDQMLLNPLDLVKWDERIVESTTTLTRQLREVLTLGLVQGLGFAKLARQVTERMNIGLNKAKRIVRTECRRVQEVANLKTMQDAHANGINIKKMWVGSLDSKRERREWHQALDGKIIDIDEKFITSRGTSALAPHQFGIAKEDINCRCTMISVHVDKDGNQLGNKIRRARDEENKGVTISYKTYNEWFKNLEGR